MIHVLGTPGPVGGANTELWHTIKLWRQAGWRVTVTPTWRIEPAAAVALLRTGCILREASPGRVRVADSDTAVGFCNECFLREIGRLRPHTRAVWVPCMNYMTDAERRLLDAAGPLDGYVFQSRYQRGVWRRLLAPWDVPAAAMHRIPGALDPSEFRFAVRPREPSRLVVGRISRADPRKYSEHTWRILEPLPDRHARLMAVGSAVRHRLGPAPAWAELLEKNAEPAETFLHSLDLLVHAGGEAVENWPRFVLEAFACGTPVVTEFRGGVPEMIDHGETGFLAEDDAELTAFALLLARDEPLRQRIARNARASLRRLADPETILEGWRKLVES